MDLLISKILMVQTMQIKHHYTTDKQLKKDFERERTALQPSNGMTLHPLNHLVTGESRYVKGKAYYYYIEEEWPRSYLISKS